MLIAPGAFVDYLIRSCGKGQFDPGAPPYPGIASDIANDLCENDVELESRGVFVRKALAGADVRPSFQAQIAMSYVGAGAIPKLSLAL